MIYQIFYNNESKSKLFKELKPYDNTGKCSKYFETDVILDIWQNNKSEWENSKYVGALSWRFQQKTYLSYNKLKQGIDKCNTPVVYLTSSNSLGYGKGLSDHSFNQCRTIAAEIDRLNILEFKIFSHDIDKHSNFSNYWLLTPVLFDEYCRFINYIKTFIDTTSNKTIREQLRIPVKYRVENKIEYFCHPFFMERLFAVWVCNKGYEYRYILPAIPANSVSRITNFYKYNKDNIILV